MKPIRKITITSIKVLGGIYIGLCIFLYFYQEQLIFFPRKLSTDFNFSFETTYEEIRIPVEGDETLSGLWFKQDSSKGLVFYLHGNAGALDGWGNLAPIYLQFGYDIFLLDYRGYGKSTGNIYSEAQFFKDVQEAYNWAKTNYSEENITVVGYSVGTGSAAYLAAHNPIQQLILQAPYYSLIDMMQHHYSIIPTFLLKYRFETYQYLPQVNAPITIFHGNQDAVIPYNSSTRLIELLKPSDRLIPLPNAGHNGMNNNPKYVSELAKLLD